MKINNKQKNRGFTLVEVLVATFIFTSIMMVSMSALMATMSASRKARALRIAMDNVNFAMESMARSIRMGNYYYCENSININIVPVEEGRDCPREAELAFSPDSDNPGNKILYGLDDNSLVRSDLIDGISSTPVPITSSEVKVEELKFKVEGSTTGDPFQPRVYIIMKGVVTAGGEEHSFALQTLASRRRYE